MSVIHPHDTQNELTINTVSNLKTHYTANSTIIAFSALVFPDGDIYAVAAHKVRLEQEARGSDVRGMSATSVAVIIADTIVISLRRSVHATLGRVEANCWRADSASLCPV